ncbi:stAR-related lipid transfer protein 3 isoform X2 [Strongylocentrotus purpuratus]|uniref:StAR-related lipid transfer protein 3 n=1 Tax=Strongylocentrotus purpuratus TaxID=7668 RepID=A0A7M7TG96_STRPU|nr:stAR-related lipid transfer protein 3 isoform X2 [Strongylocentrotus purpuratus]
MAQLPHGHAYIMPRGDEEREREARAAAQLIYSNASNDSPIIRSPTQANGTHPPISENQLPSVQTSFSAVRRVFCLLATFDLLLTAVLWFIFIQLVGLGVKDGFSCQIQKYDFHYSLFDIVAMAFFRFAVLLLAYALFKSKHWIFAAITTTATTGLIVAKIFLYSLTDTTGFPSGCAPKTSSNSSSNTFMAIVMLLTSLLLAWLELWVLDFQVIPKEKKLLEEALMAHSLETDERRPLLDNSIDRRYDLPGGQAFYSPYDSPRGSDTESITSELSGSSFKSSRTADFQSLPNSQRGSTIDLAASVDEQEYIQKAKDALVQLQGILDNTEIWKKECSEGDATVYCGTYPGITQRLYKLDAILPVLPEVIVEVIWDNIDESASWNSALLEAKRVQDINPFVDILYSVSAPGGKGVFSSRDFVTVRLCEQRGDRYVSSAIAVKHPDKPPVPQHVRGEIGVSGWVVEPAQDRPGHCRYIWIINSDIKLKVWTPQTVMDPVMGGVIISSYRDLLNHLTQQRGTASS